MLRKDWLSSLLTGNTGSTFSLNFASDGVYPQSDLDRYLGFPVRPVKDAAAPAVIPVESVSLDKTADTLVVGDTVTLSATVLPDNAKNKSVSWSSDNTDVATVDASGKVTAVAFGTATITVTTVDGTKTATCTFTVIPALFGEWKVTDGYLDGSGTDRTGWTLTLSQDRIEISIANFDPWLADLGGAEYYIPRFTWESSTETLNLAGGTETGYDIQWYGLDSSDAHEDIVFDVDVDNGTLSLANVAYTASVGDYTFSLYYAPLVFHKVASAQALTKATTAQTGTKVNIAPQSL